MPAKRPKRTRRPSSRPRPAADATPPVPRIERGSAEWMALDESVRRVESAFNIKFDAVHRKLDRLGMRGKRFLTILNTVVKTWELPEFYAWMVVRSYPGAKANDQDAARLQAYLRARRSRSAAPME